MSPSDFRPPNSIELAADVVAAYVSHNSLPANELPALIQSVQAAFIGLAGGAVQATAPAAEVREPAVSIKKSITPDFMICLEDGKKFKSLKRHLRGLGLTPQQYRAKWGLPADYPMVAPNYAALRSEMAKGIGLGKIRVGEGKRRGRPRKDQSATETQ